MYIFMYIRGSFGLCINSSLDASRQVMCSGSEASSYLRRVFCLVSRPRLLRTMQRKGPWLST